MSAPVKIDAEMTVRSALRDAMGRLQDIRVPSYALAAELLLMYALEAISACDLFASGSIARRQGVAEIFRARCAARERSADAIFDRQAGILGAGVRSDACSAGSAAGNRARGGSGDPGSESSDGRRIYVSLMSGPPLDASRWRWRTICAARKLWPRTFPAQPLKLIGAMRNDMALPGEYDLSNAICLMRLRQKEERFDLIVSNPPYVARAEESQLPREVREHEPREALFGGATEQRFMR